MEDRTVLANGVRIRYQRFNNGKPPAIFLHGVTDWGLCWLRTAESLSDLVDPILVDQRGHGYSEKPMDGYQFSDFGRDAVELATVLGLEQATLIGHSLGGAASLVAAGLSPDLFRGVIAVDPPGRPFMLAANQGYVNEHLTQMVERMARYRRLSRQQIWEIYASEHPDWALEERERTIDAKALVVEEVLTKLGMPAGFDPVATLHAIKCPVLVLRADDKLNQTLSAELAAWLQSHVRHAEIVMVEGAGHNVQRERFDVTVSKMREFLTRRT